MEQCFTLATRFEGEELKLVLRKNEQPSLHRTHKVRLRVTNSKRQSKQMGLQFPVPDLRAFDQCAVRLESRAKEFHR
jgi:hypothetical protein